MYDLSGKVALVTGAGGRHGIGRSIALRLANEGADVIVTDIEASATAIRAEDQQAGWAGLNSVVEEIESKGRQSLGLFSDVSDGPQVADMVAKTLDQFGKIDIVVNNAGSRPGKDRVPVLELEEEAFDEVQRVNVRGTFLVSKAVATHMVNRGGGGKIINISSGAGKRGIARYAAYCASKFAIIGWTQAMAQEMAAHKITVNAICPGLFMTEPNIRWSNTNPEAMENHSSRIPGAETGQPEDLGPLAVYLSSDAARYVTGAAIVIDGGFTC